MTGNIRGVRANHIHFEEKETVDGRDVLAGVMAHPVHSILHELQIVLMSELPDEKRAAQLNHKVVSVMAYIETLENHISTMKDDVENILDKHEDDAAFSGSSMAETMIKLIRNDVSKL